LELLEWIPRVVLVILRALYWLGWDFFFHVIGWYVGWLFLRALSFGHFPAAQIGEFDESPLWVQLMVALVGFAVLGCAIFLLSTQIH